MARNAPYTKILGQPVSYTQYNLHLTRGCNNPLGPQKPFPYAVQTGTGIKTGGISMTSVGSACGTSNVSLIYISLWLVSAKVNQRHVEHVLSVSFSQLYIQKLLVFPFNINNIYKIFLIYLFLFTILF